MIVVRFKVRCRPDRTEDVRAAMEAVIGPSRALEGVHHFDIGRCLDDENALIATEVFADRAALERQEAQPEVAAVLGLLEDALAAEPEATIFEVSAAVPYG